MPDNNMHSSTQGTPSSLWEQGCDLKPVNPREGGWEIDVALTVAAQGLNFCAPFSPLPVTRWEQGCDLKPVNPREGGWEIDVALTVAAQGLNFCAPFSPLPVTRSTAPAHYPIFLTPYACFLAQLIIFEVKNIQIVFGCILKATHTLTITLNQCIWGIAFEHHWTHFFITFNTINVFNQVCK